VVGQQNADIADTLQLSGNHFLSFYIWGVHWRHLVNTTEIRLNR